jgi:kumamolisin
VKFRVFLAAALLLAATVSLTAQQPPQSRGVLHLGTGSTVTPYSTLESPLDRGRRAHTNFKVFVPPGRSGSAEGFAEPMGRMAQPHGQPISGYYAETPASLACIYGLVTVVKGCPLSSATVSSGGSKAIAIVDAYDYPTAFADLAAFSQQFGLPAPTSSTFTVAYGSGSRPAPDPYCGYYGGWNCWAAESALDIEMAHAMAPSAHIYLVEATSNSYNDLFQAIAKAVALVQAAGGGEVSGSWGGSEFPGERSLDAALAGSNVVFFFSSGDSEGTEYPAASPNVVAVGGTTIGRDPKSLLMTGEYAWEDAGGGISPYETRPAYQSAVSKLVGTYRGIPDVAAVANPRTGVWVYDSFQTQSSTGAPSPWNILGGTSVSAPLWAGIVNRAGHFSASTAAELSLVYANLGKTTAYRDINYGTCGYYQGWAAVAGWDPCTGIGAPYTLAGK